MAAQDTFSPNQANVLVQLAALAAGDLSAGVFLPPGWSLLSTVTSDQSQPPPVPNAQGFYATGQLAPGGPSVVVLALGVTWGEFLNNYVPLTGLNLGDPPDGVVPAGFTTQF